MPPAHLPVLAPELVGLLSPAPGETVVDCTFGAGGHARQVAERLGARGELIAIDRDPEAAERFTEFARKAPCRTRFIGENFADALASLVEQGEPADAVYLDLGVSSMQIDVMERGFSYAYDAPLDMRMDTRQELSADEVVNDWPEERLARVLFELGEERHARAIAREVARRRPISTTNDLVEAIRDAVPPSYRFGRGHPAKRSFQAIRIAVNDELGSLERALASAWRLLPAGGRLAVIAFHSLEDRIVKRFIADLARPCICPPELPVCRCGGRPEAEALARRAVKPSPAEVGANPRSQSARLRAARKTDAPSRAAAPGRAG